MRHLLVGLGLRAFASLIAAFGLLMLELSTYFALVQIWSAISAAAILGAANFVIAAVLYMIAARPPSGHELELANEIHGSSVDALQLEARALQSQVSGVIHHPLNGVLLRDCGRTNRTITVISFIAKVAAGLSTTTPAPILPTRSDFTSRTNVL
jgi:hypothetical protein